MRISEYKEFIQKFPYLNQSFDIKKEHWKVNSVQTQVDEIFDKQNTITLNRNDLLNSRFHIPTFILKTLMWGYPTKGRGNNITNIVSNENYEYLTKVLEEYRDTKLEIEQLIEDVKSIKGLGMSTMTKFTTFLNAEINGFKSVILDDKIMQVINGGRFEELHQLRGIGNKKKTFVPYIKTLNILSKNLKVDPNQIELFLFTFGNTLSELQGEKCYDYD